MYGFESKQERLAMLKYIKVTGQDSHFTIFNKPNTLFSAG